MIDQTTHRRKSNRPSVLDIHHLEFSTRLEQCAIANQKIAKISSSNRYPVIQLGQKLPWIALILWQLLRLYLLTIINAENF